MPVNPMSKRIKSKNSMQSLYRQDVSTINPVALKHEIMSVVYQQKQQKKEQKKKKQICEESLANMQFVRPKSASDHLNHLLHREFHHGGMQVSLLHLSHQMNWA